MLGPRSRVIALAAIVTCSALTVQAADTPLTLACKGTETSKWGSAPKSSEVVNIGIIVDLQKKTVTGLSDIHLTIDDLTETRISFGGMLYSDRKLVVSVRGDLDRVTGSLVAVSNRYEDPKVMLSYDLKCKPTQRMF
jgi:hypothetical protein